MKTELKSTNADSIKDSPFESERPAFSARPRISFAGLCVTAACLLGGSGQADPPHLLGLLPSAATSGTSSLDLDLLIGVNCSSIVAPATVHYELQNGISSSISWQFDSATTNGCVYKATLPNSVMQSALQAAGNNANIALISVTVENATHLVSNPQIFTVINSEIDLNSVSTGLANPGDTGFAGNGNSITGMGVNATLTVGALATDPVSVTVATYQTPPTAPGLVFQLPGGAIYYDLFAPAADSGDSILARFYYPLALNPLENSSQIMGPPPSTFTLQFYDAGSGGYIPVVNNTLILNTTDSGGFGGYFEVTFDSTTASNPLVTGLTGTIFTLAPEPLVASPSKLWPPNHKMIPVTVDAPGGSHIVSVSSSEPEAGLGNGDLAPDWEITGPLTVNLRAERRNAGRGRIYSILLQLNDGSQNLAVVRVPHDMGKQ